MSTLAQSALVAAVAALLQAAPALSGVPIYRNRLRPLGTGSSKAVVIRKTNSDPAGLVQFGGGQDWETVIRVECYARGAVSTDTAHEPCDDLLLDVHEAIEQDPTIGGAAMSISQPRLGWDEDETDTALGVAVAQYTILHRTASRSLTAA